MTGVGKKEIRDYLVEFWTILKKIAWIIILVITVEIMHCVYWIIQRHKEFPYALYIIFERRVKNDYNNLTWATHGLSVPYTSKRLGSEKIHGDDVGIKTSDLDMLGLQCILDNQRKHMC